jgi:hypothetical protein
MTALSLQSTRSGCSHAGEHSNSLGIPQLIMSLMMSLQLHAEPTSLNQRRLLTVSDSVLLALALALAVILLKNRRLPDAAPKGQKRILNMSINS